MLPPQPMNPSFLALSAAAEIHDSGGFDGKVAKLNYSVAASGRCCCYLEKGFAVCEPPKSVRAQTLPSGTRVSASRFQCFPFCFLKIAVENGFGHECVLVCHLLCRSGLDVSTRSPLTPLTRCRCRLALVNDEGRFPFAGCLSRPSHSAFVTFVS